MYLQKENLKITIRQSLLTLLLIPALSAGSVMSQEVAAEKITYDDHAKPIFVQRCSSCHNAQKKEGDLDVTNYTSLMLGGGSGAVIERQDASGSYLYKLITHEDSPEMPPSGTKIPDPEIQMIAKWIDLGALENKGSKALKAKPKFDMAVSESATVRPEVVPVPLRIPLEPVIKPARPSVIAIATSPWAPIAAVSAPKQILLYNTQTLELEGVLPMEEGLAHSLRFSRNGKLLLAGGGRDGASGKTILFNVITGERVTTVGDELETVLASDISANHELIALGGPQKLVKIFATSDGSLIAEIKKHTDWVTALEFSPDGKYLATGDRNGGLHVWEADTGNEVFTLKAHTASISGISWRADSKVVSSASEDGTLRLWEMENGGQIKGWGAHGGGVTAVEFQRDGNLVSCGRDKVAKVWDQAGKMLRQFGGLPDVAVAVSYCDETQRILAADWSGELRVWNAADGAHIGNLASNPPRLAERLANSEAALAEATQKHMPLAQQVVQTKTDLDGLIKALEAAKQTQVQVQAKMVETEKQLAAAKQQFESTQAQHLAWQKESDEKSKATPFVKESLGKALAASQALPADPELKTTVAALDAKVKQLDSRIVELNGLVAKSGQEKNTSQAQMDEVAKVLEVTKTEMQNVTAEVTKLQGEMDAMTTKLTAETQAATAAEAVVAQANQLVQRWKGEISFISQLQTLDQQLQSTEQALTEKQAVVDAAQQKLAEAQKLVAEATGQKAEAEKQAEAIKQQIQQLREVQ